MGQLRRKIIFPIGPSIAYVPLTRNYFSLIDSESMDLLSESNWCSHIDRKTGNIYAYAHKNKKRIAMHRVILNSSPMEIGDHISGMTLDNRRCNLRNVDYSISNLNRSKHVGGVRYIEGRKRWRVRIMINKKPHHIGYCKTRPDALQARIFYEFMMIKDPLRRFDASA